MFRKSKDTNQENLEKAIDDILQEMQSVEPISAEYSALADQLAKLYSIKTTKKSDRVSKDALVAVAGNLAGIVLILQHERLHVVTSKALGFVMKIR